VLLICDTNVWIEASKDSVSPCARLLSLATTRGFRVAISKHSRKELADGTSRFGGAAEDLAAQFEEIPYFPVGSWEELLGSWNDLSGTWNDAKDNEKLREALGDIAKKGTDIRDRGALIDALRSKASYFVTSDKGLVGAAPRGRIEASLSIKVRTAAELCAELEQPDTRAG
jgi:predicted nucleic acid-binding protein